VLGTYLRRLCRRHAVEVRLKSPVRRINAKSVTLRDKTNLPSDLTIWTGGPAPSPLLSESGLAPPGDWAPVDECLQVSTHPEIYIAGDAAALPTPASKQAYHALDMGACVARNIERSLAGRQPARFRPSGKPMLVSFGDLDCFLIAGPRVLAGPSLSAGKEAVFEAVMAGLDRGPMPMRMLRALQRGDQAARELLWPTVSSLSALRRQARIRVLSGASRAP
jgi:NADH dehydrogenase